MIITVVCAVYLFVDIGADAAPSDLGHPAIVKRHPNRLIANRLKSVPMYI